MKEQEIVRMIHDVLTTTEMVVKQLRAEKKATGDYSKVVTVPYGDMEMRFEALKIISHYPPVSVRLRHQVSVMKDGKAVVCCHVAPLKCSFCVRHDDKNFTDKYKSWAFVCDHSLVKPLFQSGDTLCIDNKGKAAYVKVEVLSEKLKENMFWGSVDCLRRVRLSKVLGHQETLAYITKQGKKETYVADDNKWEEKQSDGCYWHEFTEEDMCYDSELKLAVPTTEAEILRQLRQEALKRLLYNCRAEFCYGDPSVKKYMEDYIILGEETISKIYQEYMTWLKENCTIFPEDAPSGEFTGIAIDYHGKEDQEPTFDVSDTFQ